MREDFSGVFAERAKRHSDCNKFDKGGKRRKAKIGFEDLPTKTSMRGGTCWTDYMPSPVIRFLNRNLGRPWDDVYSEICEANDSRTEAGRNIKEMLGRDGCLINFDAHMIDGVPHDSKGSALRAGFRYRSFFINNDTGMLCQAPRERRDVLQKYRKDFIKLDELTQCHEVAGVWYKVKFKEYDLNDFYPHCTGFLVGKKHLDLNDYSLPYYFRDMRSEGQIKLCLRDLYGALIWPISKEQCGKKELKFIRSTLELWAKAEKKAG